MDELPADVENMHFLSDGPVTQYRNKLMFYMLACKIPDLCPNIVNWTWNYTEAGHGKGAPDGIEAVCKRTADNIVACGSDIADINEFCSAVQDRCPNIKLFAVSDNEIDNMSLLISENQPNLVSFSGTLKVHQVQGNVFLPGKLIMKNLSCFCDNNGCEHYRLGVLKYDRQSRTTVDAVYGNSDSEQSEPGSASINIENEKSKDVKAQEIRNGIPTKKSEKTGSKATKESPINCHKQYRTRSGLAKHLKTCGVRDRSKCQHCGISFGTYAGVRAHELRSHRELYYNELRVKQKLSDSEIFTALAAIEVRVDKTKPFIKEMMEATGLTKDQVRHRRSKPIYQEYLRIAQQELERSSTPATPATRSLEVAPAIEHDETFDDVEHTTPQRDMDTIDDEEVNARDAQCTDIVDDESQADPQPQGNHSTCMPPRCIAPDVTSPICFPTDLTSYLCNEDTLESLLRRELEAARADSREAVADLAQAAIIMRNERLHIFLDHWIANQFPTAVQRSGANPRQRGATPARHYELVDTGRGQRASAYKKAQQLYERSRAALADKIISGTLLEQQETTPTVEAVEEPATTVTVRPPTWATPEKEEVYGTVVRMEGEEQDVWKVVQRVKKNLEGKVNNVKAVRKTAGGAVIIESKDRDQQKLIVESLKTDRELKVKGDGLIKPKLKITGVTKGYKAEDIANEILTQNEKLAEGLKDGEREIRLLRRIPCRNVVKENWIIETSPALFKRMAKQGTITFDLEVLYVEEQRDVALCFRCCKYGHMAKLCREESYCFVCVREGVEEDVLDEPPEMQKDKDEDMVSQLMCENAEMRKELKQLRKQISQLLKELQEEREQAKAKDRQRQEEEAERRAASDATFSNMMESLKSKTKKALEEEAMEAERASFKRRKPSTTSSDDENREVENKKSTKRQHLEAAKTDKAAGAAKSAAQQW
nr:unnamed protein product [Callosobruchus analis]